ncbi:MAG: molybdenum cofactor guanylyltransferase [Armatimonadetes bacterium]|nr:molybdenum cofactor guanylyltransferase [Armatimonadota bacterium]
MAAIILAGGVSSRMGQDKAMLMFDGQTLLERAVRIAADVSRPVWIVANRAGHYHVHGATVIGDGYPGEGPLGGLITGLKAAGPGVHIAMACDTPLMEPKVFSLLLSKIGEHDAALFKLGDGLQPLGAAYRDKALPSLIASFEAGNRALHIAVKSLDAVILGDDELLLVDPAVLNFTNINDLDDYADLLGEPNEEL